MEFQLICADDCLKLKSLPNLLSHLVRTDTTQSYSHMITVLSRMLAATPHSADVERSISANNLLKTALRSRLKLETENNYLFVHFNLPPFAEWNPQKAVLHWLTTKDRRAHNLTVENESRKAKNQPYFKGIFPQSSTTPGEKDNESDKNDVVFKKSTKKRYHL